MVIAGSKGWRQHAAVGTGGCLGAGPGNRRRSQHTRRFTVHKSTETIGKGWVCLPQQNRRIIGRHRQRCLADGIAGAVCPEVADDRVVASISTGNANGPARDRKIGAGIGLAEHRAACHTDSIATDQITQRAITGHTGRHRRGAVVGLADTGATSQRQRPDGNARRCCRQRPRQRVIPGIIAGQTAAGHRHCLAGTHALAGKTGAHARGVKADCIGTVVPAINCRRCTGGEGTGGDRRAGRAVIDLVAGREAGKCQRLGCDGHRSGATGNRVIAVAQPEAAQRRQRQTGADMIVCQCVGDRPRQCQRVGAIPVGHVQCTRCHIARVVVNLAAGDLHRALRHGVIHRTSQCQRYPGRSDQVGRSVTKVIVAIVQTGGGRGRQCWCAGDRRRNVFRIGISETVAECCRRCVAVDIGGCACCKRRVDEQVALRTVVNEAVTGEAGSSKILRPGSYGPIIRIVFAEVGGQASLVHVGGCRIHRVNQPAAASPRELQGIGTGVVGELVAALDDNRIRRVVGTGRQYRSCRQDDADTRTVHIGFGVDLVGTQAGQSHAAGGTGYTLIL